MKKMLYISVCIVVIIITLSIYFLIHNFKTKSLDITIPFQKYEFEECNKNDIENTIKLPKNYKFKEHVLKVETTDIHVDIQYPQILREAGSDIDTLSINKILTPSEDIRMLYDAMIDGEIKIDDYGELMYDASQHTYHFGINHTYTLGLATDKFFNLKYLSIDYIRNSHWDYGSIFINVQTGKSITDLFDEDAFRECILNSCFKADRVGFDIPSYFKNISDESLSQYFKNAFITSNRKVEIILNYGDPDHIVIYADLNKVEKMIKPQYLEYLQ